MGPARRTARGITKWTLTLAFAGFSLLIPANLLWRWYGAVLPSVAINIFDGLIAIRTTGPADPPMPLGITVERERRAHIKFKAEYAALKGGGVTAVFPITYVAAACGLPACIFWWRDVRARRRDVVGKCRACGYDLHGLTQSCCPECGRDIDKAALTQVQAA